MFSMTHKYHHLPLIQWFDEYNLKLKESDEEGDEDESDDSTKAELLLAAKF